MRALIAVRAAAVCALVLAAAPAARAQSSRPLTPEELAQLRGKAQASRLPERPEALLLIAPRVAVALPLGGTPLDPGAGLEVEYVTPLLHRRLALSAQAQWTALSFQRQAFAFAALPGFQTQVRQTSGVLAAVLRTTGLGKGGEAYLGGGPGLFVTSVTSRFGGARRGEHDVRAGVSAFGGVDLYAGPGSIFLELHAQYAPSSLPALGHSSVVPVSLGVGYRFVLPR